MSRSSCGYSVQSVWITQKSGRDVTGCPWNSAPRVPRTLPRHTYLQIPSCVFYLSVFFSPWSTPDHHQRVSSAEPLHVLERRTHQEVKLLLASHEALAVFIEQQQQQQHPILKTPAEGTPVQQRRPWLQIVQEQSPWLCLGKKDKWALRRRPHAIIKGN